MALIIYPDSRCEEKPWQEAKAIFECFDCVPGLHVAGYIGLVDDAGLIKQLPLNRRAEYVCGYAPLAGPLVLVTLEEAGEDALLCLVNPDCKKTLEDRLQSQPQKQPLVVPCEPSGPQEHSMKNFTVQLNHQGTTLVSVSIVTEDGARRDIDAGHLPVCRRITSEGKHNDSKARNEVSQEIAEYIMQYADEPLREFLNITPEDRAEWNAANHMGV